MGEITIQKIIIHFLTKISLSFLFFVLISLLSLSIKLISLFFVGYITNKPLNQSRLTVDKKKSITSNNFLSIYFNFYLNLTLFFYFTVWLLQAPNKMWLHVCEPYLLDKYNKWIFRHGLSTMEQCSKQFVLQLWLLQSRFACKPQDRLVKSGYLSPFGTYRSNNRLYNRLLPFSKLENWGLYWYMIGMRSLVAKLWWCLLNYSFKIK